MSVTMLKNEQIQQNEDHSTTSRKEHIWNQLLCNRNEQFQEQFFQMVFQLDLKLTNQVVYNLILEYLENQLERQIDEFSNNDQQYHLDR